MNACSARANRQTNEKQSNYRGRARPDAPACPNLAHAIDNTLQKQQSAAIGTGRALTNRISSGALDSAQTWGGRRNSAARTSDSLSLNQATQIIEAAQFAAAIGLPFNRHVIIHWEQAGVADCRATGATGRFLKLASDWVAKRGGRIAWAWVRENGCGKGSHVHILLHLPANIITGKNGRGIGNMPRRWLRSITGAPYVASTIRTERIGGTARAAATIPAAYQANLAAVVAYILKGACPAAVKALGLERLEAGGTIIGKRSATSQNIGRAVREGLLK